MTNFLPPPAYPEAGSSSSASPTPDVQALIIASNPQPPVDPKLEMQWKNSLQNLEHKMEVYKEARAKEGHPSERVAEDVATAMERVGEIHTDPNVKKHWKERAKLFRAAGENERDGILEEIGKGFLMLLTAPFFLVGAVLQAAGGILSGVGSILKGLGRLTRKLTYTGSSK